MPIETLSVTRTAHSSLHLLFLFGISLPVIKILVSVLPGAGKQQQRAFQMQIAYLFNLKYRTLQKQIQTIRSNCKQIRGMGH